MGSRTKNRSKRRKSPKRTPFRSARKINHPLLRLWKKWKKNKDPEKIFELMNDYSYSILDLDSIDFLKRYEPLIEIGARNGYLVYLLRQAGIEMVAFDPAMGEMAERQVRIWSPVKIGGDRYVKYFPHHNLLLNWPPADMELGYHTLKNFNEASKARYVIFIGEYRNQTLKTNGRLKGMKYTTGTSKFYDYLEEHFIQVATKKLPNWTLTSSKLYVFEKNLFF